MLKKTPLNPRFRLLHVFINNAHNSLDKLIYFFHQKIDIFQIFIKGLNPGTKFPQLTVAKKKISLFIGVWWSSHKRRHARCFKRLKLIKYTEYYNRIGRGMNKNLINYWIKGNMGPSLQIFTYTFLRPTRKTPVYNQSNFDIMNVNFLPSTNRKYIIQLLFMYFNKGQISTLLKPQPNINLLLPRGSSNIVSY